MNKNSCIFVAGGETLVGAVLLRQLEQQGYTNIAGKPGEEPELSNADQIDAFFARANPEYVFLVAGKSGGIGANQKYPADLMYDNLIIESNVIHAAYRYQTRKLLYLASSCCYPKQCPQPMKVESLLTGPLEPTNEAYALAKIAGIKLCQAYRKQYGADFTAGIPANIFGPGDDFSEEDSHVIGALIRKMHEAKLRCQDSVEIWGTGNARRDFIFADDLADSCIFIMQKYEANEPINLGTNNDFSIRELATLIKKITGYSGNLIFNSSKPDGMPLKALDTTRLIEMGWRSQTPFETALLSTYDWYLQTIQEGEDVHE